VIKKCLGMAGVSLYCCRRQREQHASSERCRERQITGGAVATRFRRRLPNSHFYHTGVILRQSGCGANAPTSRSNILLDLAR
jgi:hypothetical protein